MNSPLYLGVVIKPDAPAGQQVTTVSYSEDRGQVTGDAVREWQKAQHDWESSGGIEAGAEPPMWDVYICERRAYGTAGDKSPPA